MIEASEDKDSEFSSSELLQEDARLLAGGAPETEADSLFALSVAAP